MQSLAHLQRLFAGLAVALAFAVLAGCSGGSSAPPCVNGFQDPGETGIDCGGVCGACPDALCGSASECASLNCTAGTCAAPTCTDGIFNGREMDTDCGGPCRPCATVTPSTCTNGTQDGTETGVDCGGSCVACGAADRCANGQKDADEDGVDCGGPCPACTAAPTCADQIRNQGETGVDCGGPCAACAPVETCNDGLRNQGEAGVDCGGPCAACDVPPTCNDGVRNQGEAGVDCGGPCENLCEVTPTCSDGVRNQGETGVDCGGEFCAPCEGMGLSCEDGVDCVFDCGPSDQACHFACIDRLPSSADIQGVRDCYDWACQSGDDEFCTENAKVLICFVHRCGTENNCNDGENGSYETDQDCGGACEPCANGRRCEEDRDCRRGSCDCFESGCICGDI